MQFYSVTMSHDDPTLYALLRVEGPLVDRWQPEDREWIPAVWMIDYIYGDEWGARPISAAEAERLKTSGTLIQLSAKAVARLDELARQRARRARGDTGA